jgi:FkbM family methyltransferase
VNVYDDVFVSGQYNVEAGGAQFIVDAGAHIGLASVYFAQRYPNARVVAVELEGANYRMLKLNARAYPNIVPIHAGLWSSAMGLKIVNHGADTWSFRAEAGTDVPSVTVQGLLNRFGSSCVDVLKIDIEGGEKEVLEHSDGWIERVKMLVIELHDRHVPGCSQALDKAVEGRGFSRSALLDNLVLVHD